MASDSPLVVEGGAGVTPGRRFDAEAAAVLRAAVQEVLQRYPGELEAAYAGIVPAADLRRLPLSRVVWLGREGTVVEPATLLATLAEIQHFLGFVHQRLDEVTTKAARYVAEQVESMGRVQHEIQRLTHERNRLRREAAEARRPAVAEAKAGQPPGQAPGAGDAPRTPGPPGRPG